MKRSEFKSLFSGIYKEMNEAAFERSDVFTWGQIKMALEKAGLFKSEINKVARELNKEK